jgi:hypothetical protein
MESIQKKAIHAMVARDLLRSETLQNGEASLSDFGEAFTDSHVLEGLSERDTKMIEFLAKNFNQISEGGSADLRRRTGLRRMV